MFFVSIIFLTILIPSIQSKPTLKLTFTPDDKYYTMGNQVEIHCEIINPGEHTESPQLWHLDLKTGKHTSVSRSLLYSPTDDAPEVFKQNKVKRIEYVRKNHIRIRQLYLEDTAQYECTCPDCEEHLPKAIKELQVMKLSEPRWQIEPGWPIQENAKTTLKCTAEDFYPFVDFKVIRNHHDISKEGKSVKPNSNTNPQSFSWEAIVTPTADWHNTTLVCTVTEGNSEQHAVKHLEVIFTPRFGKCEEKQHVNTTKDKASIECSYSGNPQPKLTWFRQTDDKPIVSDATIHIETKDEHHGKYKSILTFDRDKLTAIPLTTTTTKVPNGPTDPASQTKVVIGENYYLQLLNGGFTVKLNDEKAQKIHILSDANQARSSDPIDSSTRKTIENLSTSIILFSFLISLYMIQHH